MMETIANTILIAAIVFCVAVWIKSLISWDGKCPCRLEDCETCPYAGACEDQERLKQLKEEENHE